MWSSRRLSCVQACLLLELSAGCKPGTEADEAGTPGGAGSPQIVSDGAARGSEGPREVCRSDSEELGGGLTLTHLTDPARIRAWTVQPEGVVLWMQSRAAVTNQGTVVEVGTPEGCLRVVGDMAPVRQLESFRGDLYGLGLEQDWRLALDGQGTVETWTTGVGSPSQLRGGETSLFLVVGRDLYRWEAQQPALVVSDPSLTSFVQVHGNDVYWGNDQREVTAQGADPARLAGVRRVSQDGGAVEVLSEELAGPIAVGDQAVFFVGEGCSLWTVPLSGGTARQLASCQPYTFLDMTALGNTIYITTKGVDRRLLAFDISREQDLQVGEWELEVDGLGNDGVAVYGYADTLFRLDFLVPK